jgi:hypothetical protein
MTNLELLFSALGEELTRVQAIKDNAQGYNENLEAAIKGGKSAGDAVKSVEKSQGIKVVSKENFLPKGDDKKELPSPEK